MSNPKILSIIPARGGSKGIPRKNIKDFLGKPLIYHSIKVSLGCELVDKTVVSSDDDEILRVAESFGAEALKRPAKLATDEAPTEPCLIHAVKEYAKNGYTPDLVMLLQPTSPYREVEDIENAIKTFINSNSDSLLSVVPSHAFIWKETEKGPRPINYDYKNRKRRQDMELEYKENGSIYITKTKILLNDKNRLGGDISLYVMDGDKGIDLDSLLDWEHLEAIMKSRQDD